jgi:hypothetical protein
MADRGHPGEVLAALSDPARLRVFAALLLGARAAADIERQTGLGSRDVERSLARLRQAGLVDDDFGAVAERLGRAARDVAGMRVAVTPEDLGATPEQAAVLRNFMEDGRLTALPMPLGKRRVVLDFLAAAFDPGQVYPEPKVNAILARFHPDVAALRRALVDEEFLERRDGFYWRAGGTFEVE